MQWHDLAGGVQHLSPEAVQQLDAMIARSLSMSEGVGFVQVWAYVQVERGVVRQVGVSPVVGASVRFADGGRVMR
jgi:hypothetical protein